MTIVKENFLTNGLSGMFDKKVVFRQRTGRTIFAKPPRKQTSVTPRQEAQKEKFLEAVDYAAGALSDPMQKEAYRKMAPLGTSAYNMAIADFLKPPKVTRIDATGYSGIPGEMISVFAEDNCKVKSVSVSIALDDGTVVEEGEAVQVGDGRKWSYTATKANPHNSGMVISAIATDVPNHTGTGMVTL